MANTPQMMLASSHLSMKPSHQISQKMEQVGHPRIEPEYSVIQRLFLY
jgi:hypothetical protein